MDQKVGDMMIEINNLTKHYENTTLGISNINFSIGKKGLHIISGPNGCGKTTLLNVIGLVDEFNSGEYYFDGQDISSLNKDRLNDIRFNEIGYVFQDFKLFEELTVLENLILFKKNSLPNEEMLSLLDEFGLSSLTTTKVKFLSTGEKQRLCIVRAIMKSPKVLLCDEPTGNLDNRNVQIIVKCLYKISKNIPVIIVTHDIDIFKDYKYKHYLMCNGALNEEPVVTKKNDVLNRKTIENKEKFSTIKWASLINRKVLKNSFKNNFLNTISSMIIFVLMIFSISLASFNETNFIWNIVNYNEEQMVGLKNDKNHLYGTDFSEVDTIFQNVAKIKGKRSKSGNDILYYEDYSSVLDVDIISGTYPTSNNQILVSSYFYKENEEKNVYSFNGYNLEIIGVYDCKFSYESYKDNDLNRDRTFNSIVNRVYVFDSTKFMSDTIDTINFIEPVNDINVSDFSGESIYLNWDIKPIVNEDSISLYAGTLPTYENEILISRKIYSNLSNKNIIDKEISFDFNNYRNGELTHIFTPYNAFTNLKIVGVFNSNNYEVMVNQDSFDLLLKEYNVNFSTKLFKVDASINNIKKIIDMEWKVESLYSNSYYSIINVCSKIKELSLYLSLIFILIFMLSLIKSVVDLNTAYKKQIGTLLCLGVNIKSLSFIELSHYLIIISISFIISLLMSISLISLFNSIISAHYFLYFEISAITFNCLSFLLLPTIFIIILIVFIFIYSKYKKSNIVSMMK